MKSLIGLDRTKVPDLSMRREKMREKTSRNESEGWWRRECEREWDWMNVDECGSRLHDLRCEQGDV